VGLCVQENKRIELVEKIREAKHSVTLYTSAIENMKAQRDATVSDIDRFQLQLDVCCYQVTAFGHIFCLVRRDVLSVKLCLITYITLCTLYLLMSC